MELKNGSNIYATASVLPSEQASVCGLGDHQSFHFHHLASFITLFLPLHFKCIGNCILMQKLIILLSPPVTNLLRFTRAVTLLWLQLFCGGENEPPCHHHLYFSCAEIFFIPRRCLTLMVDFHRKLDNAYFTKTINKQLEITFHPAYTILAPRTSDAT